MAIFNVDGKSVTQITDGSPVLWGTNCGDLFLNAGATIPYNNTTVTAVWLRAHNQTKSGTLNAGATVHTINITGVFPIKCYAQIRWRPDKRGVILNVKRDGSLNGRILGDGQLVKDRKLTFRNVPDPQYLEWEAFFDWHYPHLAFKFFGLQAGDVARYQFLEPSEVTRDSRGANSWESFLVWVGDV